jgi:hypothetical protein
MTLSKSQRAAVRKMFDGNCAYCGNPLGERWHADHVEAVMRDSKYVNSSYVDGVYKPARLVATGVLLRPENDHAENIFPSCIACNINKSCYSLEDWREVLHSLVAVARRNSAPFRHAERFGRITTSDAPIVFYFEKLALEAVNEQRNRRTRGWDSPARTEGTAMEN